MSRFLEFVGQQQAKMNGLVEHYADKIRNGVDEEVIYAELLTIMDREQSRAATVACMAVFRLAEIEARDEEPSERTVAVSEAYL